MRYEMSQPRFVAIGVLLVNQTVRGGFVQEGSDRTISDASLFFAGLTAQVTNGAAQLRIHTTIADTLFLRRLYPLFAGLMMWQGLSFQYRIDVISKQNPKYNR